MAHPHWRLPAALLTWLLAGCAGPATSIAAPDLALLDGRQLPPPDPITGTRTLPFRYYGTTIVDALPGTATDERPDFTLTPTRVHGTLAEPVSPWLFPFDFPLELLGFAFGGQQPQVLGVHLPENPDKVAAGFRPAGLIPLRDRALRARIER
ncbi:MAG: hypothetical protein IPK26_27865 [Planctomycetes bacterium]|nr:hypothetical protein [Planctomycetota bacterium]